MWLTIAPLARVLYSRSVATSFTAADAKVVRKHKGNRNRYIADVALEDIDMGDYLNAVCRVCVKLTTITVRCTGLSNNTLADALACTKCLSRLAVDMYRGPKTSALPHGVALSTLMAFWTVYSHVDDSLMVALSEKCSNLVFLHVFRASHKFLRLRTVTDAGVRAVLQGCLRLRNTDVEYAIGISHPLRLELIKRQNLTELVRLAMGLRVKWSYLRDALLVSVLEVSPRLKKLQLQWNRITDAIAYAFAKHCLKLEHIDWVADGTLTATAVTNLLATLGARLRYVRFASAPGLDEIIAQSLAQHCPLLEEYHRPTVMSDTVMVALAQRCTQLRTVDLAHTAVGDDAVVALSTHCKKLTTLHL
jgi:hypothetical protein